MWGSTAGQTLRPLSDQYRDVANLATAVGVAVRVHNLVECVAAPDHGAQRAGIDQLLQEHEIGLCGSAAGKFRRRRPAWAG